MLCVTVQYELVDIHEIALRPRVMDVIHEIRADEPASACDHHVPRLVRHALEELFWAVQSQ